MYLPRRLLALELKRRDCWKDFLLYQRTLIKLANNKTRIDFLEACKHACIIPKFLKFRIPQNGCFDDNSVHEFQKRLLNVEISKAKETQNSLQEKLNIARDTLKHKTPTKCLPSVVLYTNIERRQQIVNRRNTHTKKLLTLSEDQGRPLFNVRNTVVCCGLDKEPPKYVLETLSLGPKSAVLDSFNPKVVLTELDLFMDYCEEKYIPEDVVTDINVKTLSYIKKCKKMKNSRNINKTKEYLKNNELLAVPFDKGIGICVMKKTNYNEKMNEIINLPQFEKVVKKRENEKHPIIKEEERIQKVLKDMLEAEEISKNLYDKMRPRGSQPPRLYGLAKVHKENIPVRPVLSMPGSAYHGVANQVAFWLSYVEECKINCSTQTIRDSLKDLQLDENTEFVSFDVKSLYTNVPVSEAIQVCADLLYNGINPRPPVSKETFIKLAEISSCNVILSTHDGLYRQVDGLAMGSPPAPHLANGWMNQFDKTVQGSSAVYFRYMDDILKDEKTDEIDDKLSEINNLHPNLEFTIEREKNGELPCLDMKLIHRNGTISSTWYTKPTDTGLIMNFHALAPKRYKRSVVSGMVHRIYRACSSEEHLQESLCRAKVILTNNQYPERFFQPIIEKTLARLQKAEDDSSNTSVDSSDSCVSLVVSSHDLIGYQHNIDKYDLFKFFVQYRGKVSEHFANALHACGAPCMLVFTLRKLKTVMPPLKPSVEKELKSGLVYKIECPRCQACYVGQTARHLQTRMREHKNNKGPVKTHFAECDSIFTLDCVTILASVMKSEKHLLTMEALFIKELDPILNTKDEYKQRTLKIRL